MAFSVKSVSMLMKSLHVNHMGLYMSTSVKQINRAFISFRQVIWVIFLTLGKLKVSNTVALLTLGKSQMFFFASFGQVMHLPTWESKNISEVFVKYKFNLKKGIEWNKLYIMIYVNVVMRIVNKALTLWKSNFIKLFFYRVNLVVS